MDVVLVNPLIPQNTGSIARTCAATQTPLHLVGELGFEISERTVRRAGLDYWPWVDLRRHESFDAYLAASNPAKVWLFSTHAERSYTDAEFAPDDALVFGAETTGLPRAIVSAFPREQLLRIPYECPHVRSLNLSNAVAIALFEARRQLASAQASAATSASKAR